MKLFFLKILVLVNCLNFSQGLISKIKFSGSNQTDFFILETENKNSGLMNQTRVNLKSNHQKDIYLNFSLNLAFLFLSKENFELRLKTNWDTKDEWYCQSIPENFFCYFEDIWLSSTYLYLPLTLLILCFVFSKNLNKTLLNNFLITGFITMFFWSFIGWYPPLRFGLYSYGNILMLFCIFYFTSFESKKIKIAYIFTIFFGLLNISHWNNPNLLEITFLDYSSLIFLLIFIYLLINQKKLRSE